MSFGEGRDDSRYDLPYEPPPPYSEYPEPEGYYPPPVHGAFAYVPVPVMMPLYQTLPPPHSLKPVPQRQFTYVTNYYYQQPTQSKPITDKDLINWIPATESNCSELTHKAVVAGINARENSPFWVIRAHHAGELIPGKLAINHRAADVSHEGKEVPVHNFEVLCAPPHAVCWLPTNGQVPPGAIAAGYAHNGEPLYIGRGKYLDAVTPGKVHPSHGCCYITYDGGEISLQNYDVLCRIVI